MITIDEYGEVTMKKLSDWKHVHDWLQSDASRYELSFEDAIRLYVAQQANEGDNDESNV